MTKSDAQNRDNCFRGGRLLGAPAKKGLPDSLTMIATIAEHNGGRAGARSPEKRGDSARAGRFGFKFSDTLPRER